MPVYRLSQACSVYYNHTLISDWSLSISLFSGWAQVGGALSSAAVPRVGLGRLRGTFA